MDLILFVIKDQLPKDVVDNIYEPLNELKAVRNILDMIAFVLIVSTRVSNTTVHVIFF